MFENIVEKYNNILNYCTVYTKGINVFQLTASRWCPLLVRYFPFTRVAEGIVKNSRHLNEQIVADN